MEELVSGRDCENFDSKVLNYSPDNRCSAVTELLRCLFETVPLSQLLSAVGTNPAMPIGVSIFLGIHRASQCRMPPCLQMLGDMASKTSAGVF